MLVSRLEANPSWPVMGRTLAVVIAILWLSTLPKNQERKRHGAGLAVNLQLGVDKLAIFAVRRQHEESLDLLPTCARRAAGQPMS